MPRKVLLPGIIFFSSLYHTNAQSGQQIFQQNCATCHALDKVITGPALEVLKPEARGPTGPIFINGFIIRELLYPTTAIYTGSEKEYNQIMPSQSVSDEEIDAIFDYIKTAPPPSTDDGKGIWKSASGSEPSDNSSSIWYYFPGSCTDCIDPDAGEQQSEKII